MEIISVVAREWGEGRGDYKEIAKELQGKKELFCILIIGVVAWIYTCIKIHKTVYLKKHPF